MGLGAFAGGAAQGIMAGNQLANSYEARQRSEQERSIRDLGLGRAKQEDADMQTIKNAQMEAANAIPNADPEEMALATTRAGMQSASKLGRGDVASQFYAANTAIKAGMAKQSIDTALKLQDPTYIGKALSVLTETKMNVSMNPDGSMTIDDGTNKQDIPRDSVTGFISNLANPAASAQMSHELYMEAQKARLKDNSTLFGKQLDYKAKLGEIAATGEQARLTEKSKTQNPKDNYMAVPENSSVVDLRTGQAVAGGASGPPESYTPELQKRASDAEKSILKDLGTSEVDENGFVTHKHSPESEQASILAGKLILGSATGKKDSALSDVEAANIAKDVVTQGDKSKYKYREALVKDGDKIFKVPMVVGNGKQLMIGKDKEDVTDQYNPDGTPKAAPEKSGAGLGTAAPAETTPKRHSYSLKGHVQIPNAVLPPPAPKGVAGMLGLGGLGRAQ